MKGTYFMDRRNFLQKLGQGVVGIIAAKVGVDVLGDDGESLADLGVEEFTGAGRLEIDPGVMIGTSAYIPFPEEGITLGNDWKFEKFDHDTGVTHVHKLTEWEIDQRKRGERRF